MKETLEEQKEALIELIEWYRDCYHRNYPQMIPLDNQLIEQTRAAKSELEIEIYNKIVDGWLE